MSDTKFVNITDRLTMVDEGHLGGFIIEGDPATYTPNLWNVIKDRFDIHTMVDVGCGMGYALRAFHNMGVGVVGIDGSEFAATRSPMKSSIVKHDFSTGPIELGTTFDLGWSCEFVEHVEEQYMQNWLPIFGQCRYAAITYAGPDQDGHHHVNCQPKEYWIEKFATVGLQYDHMQTEELKRISYQDALIYNHQFKDNHFYNRGLFFIKEQ